jgi:hypothetical protein
MFIAVARKNDVRPSFSSISCRISANLVGRNNETLAFHYNTHVLLKTRALEVIRI